MLAVAVGFCELVRSVVRSCPLTFCGRDEEITAMNGDRAWVPVSRDKSGWGKVSSLRRCGQIENCDGVDARICYEQALSVRGQGKRIGHRAAGFRSRHIRIQHPVRLTTI